MKKETICGIYKITSPSNRVYIGQGVNIKKRIRTYKNLHCVAQKRLYASFIKYGVENHIFEIIEECEKEDLDCLERYWQDFYDVIGVKGLNCSLTSCKILNKKGEISEDKRKLLSESHRGIKPSEKSTNLFINMITNRTKSKEERKKISDRMKGDKHFFYGKNLTEEHKLKIGESNKGKNKKFSETHRKNLSDALKGMFKDENHPKAKLILCTETGIFYYTLKEASITYNIKTTTLSSMLTGVNKNKTSLIYL